MERQYLILLGVIVAAIGIYFLTRTRNHFNPPIGADLCTWFVDKYGHGVPVEYQHGMYSACKDYQAKCSPAQTFGELKDILKTKSTNYQNIISRLDGDNCGNLARCSFVEDCQPRYTNLQCINGMCN